jgi:fumarylacetoacetate (FAA) hydrolase
MYRGGNDDLLGPMDDIVLAHAEWGIDFVAKVAVVTGDVPMGVTPDEGVRQTHPSLFFLLESDQKVNV